MGYYSDGNYHVAKEEDFNAFTEIYAFFFLFRKVVVNKKNIKSFIKEEFESVFNNSLNKKLETPKDPNENEFEKLRLEFNTKECVFNYYIILNSSYKLSSEERIKNTLTSLLADFGLNKSHYFSMCLIQDYFNDLEENIKDYLFLEKYRQILEQPSEEIIEEIDEIGDKTLSYYITNLSVYEKLIDGLIQIEFLNFEGKPNLPNRRINSDLAILYIRLDEAKLISARDLSEQQIVKIIKNTFETSPTIGNFNKLKNKNLNQTNLSDERLTNDQLFYEKLKFIASINDKA